WTTGREVRFGDVFPPAHAERVAVGLDLDAVGARHAGTRLPEASEALEDLIPALQTSVRDGRRQTLETLLEARLKAGMDGGLFALAIGRAAEHEGIGAAIGSGDESDLDTLADLLPVLVEKPLLDLAQQGARRSNQVQTAARPQLFEVLLACDAAIEDPDARRPAVERLHLVHDLFERRRIGSIAGKDLVAQRQAAARHHQADDDLHALRMAVARVAARRLRVARAAAFEVAARQVVQQQIEGLLKEGPEARFQVRLDR